MTAVTEGWRLGVLGAFTLAYNDRVVSFTHGTARILAYLAVQERPHRRDHVAWTLWGDLSEEHALAALRSALWRLPHEPGHPLVDCDGHHLALDRHVAVDLAAAHTLLAALAAGRELPEGVDLAAVVQDVLPDWYDDWIVFPREQLRQRRLHCLEAVSRRCIEAGDFVRAIEFALRAVECEPLRETAHRCLIAGHLAEGNLTEAIRQRDAYLIRLTEAGLPPVLSHDLDALMRAGAPDADVGGPTAPAPPSKTRGCDEKGVSSAQAPEDGVAPGPR
jgi:DNA-binding SARP family transcriptional activator